MEVDRPVTDAASAEVGNEGLAQAMQQRSAEEDRDARRTGVRVDLFHMGGLDVARVEEKGSLVFALSHVHAVHLDESEQESELATEWRLLAHEVPVARGQLPAEDTAAALAEAVRESLRRHTALFLGTQEANHLLTRASVDLPDVVKETLRALPLARVAEILRRLVEEEVAIRNLRDILETLSDAAQREKDVYALTELVRIGLKRQLCYRYAPAGRLNALLLEPALEEMLRGAVRVNGGAQQLALDPAQMSQLMQRFKDDVQRHQPAAIVTAVDIRRHVRKLIEPDCFDTPVLSYHELMPTLHLEVLGRVGGDGTPMLEVAS